MSSKRKPRQILGMNNSKVESDIGRISYAQEALYFTNNSAINSKNENEKKKNLNQSKESVAMSFENINRKRLEEMASYWPYAQFISPFCGPTTYGIISSGPGVTYQVPIFPSNPPMSGQSYENRNTFSSDECSSSNGTNSNCSLQSSKITNQNLNNSLKSEDAKFSSSSHVILNQKQFVELTRLAMKGSETAERIAYTHRNRPCFKKIDSLCARMKQDLIRPDGVLPNINSQGIAWAVKDFIFVFTRVINAWIIIKGYVYNTPEGLNKIKASLSPDFMRSFAAWQDTTMDFVENLIKSFVNLDHLVQSQKTPFQKNENSPKSTSSTPIKNLSQNVNFEATENFDETFEFLNVPTENTITSQTENTATVPVKPSVENIGLNKSYYSTLIEDSEESQRKATVNGTYFKTGVYNPIWKDSITNLDPLYLPGIRDCESSIKENVLIPGSLEKVLPITFGTTNCIENLVWSGQKKNSTLLFLPSDNTNIGKGMNNISKNNLSISESENNNSLSYGENMNNNNKNNIFNDVSINQNNYENENINFISNKLANMSNNTNLVNENNNQNDNTAPINGEGDGKLLNAIKNISKAQISKNCFSYDFKVLEKNVSKFSNSFDPTVTKPIGHDTVKKLEVLLKKIQNLPEGNLFFEERFMKNYFPDFMSKCPKFLDLRSIFLKAQVGGYAHVNEFVQDLKLIIKYVNFYLKTTKHEILETAINNYETAIDKILKDEIFKEYNFDVKTEFGINNNF